MILLLEFLHFFGTLNIQDSECIIWRANHQGMQRFRRICCYDGTLQVTKTNLLPDLDGLTDAVVMLFCLNFFSSKLFDLDSGIVVVEPTQSSLLAQPELSFVGGYSISIESGTSTIGATEDTIAC